jgi:hypothetical protein
MKPVVTRLYAVLVALTFVGLFAWAGADWYQLQQKSLDQGRASLRQAAGWIAELSVRHLPLDAPTLNRLFAETAQGRWKMLLLSSPERGTEYYKGPRPVVPIDQAVPRWEPNAMTEVKVAIPVFRAVGDPMVLEGITEFYGRPEVFSLLKACGTTLVVLLVLTTVMVVLSSRGRVPVPEQEPAQEPEPESQPEPAPALRAETEPDFEEESPETIGTIAVDSEDEYWFDDELTLEDLPPLDSPPPAPAPVAALSDESGLEARLANELGLADDSGTDLSLMLLGVQDHALSPAAWADAVRAAFPDRELAFEYEGGAAVVLPGRTLEQALKAARVFVDDAERTLGGTVVHAGVAARAGRVLAAATLLAEAASARRRSLAGSVRVLGLKVDPDRYRAHVASA